MAGGTQAERFSLGQEVAGGEFVRQQSRFRERVGPGEAFPAEPGRYHLYVALACPWSQRAVILRTLKRLEDVISISYLDPYRDDRGWAFSGGGFTDEVNGFAFLKEAYDATAGNYEGRVTVPVIWDKVTGQVVSNESGDITRMLGSAFDAWGDASVDLYPADLREEIDALNRTIYDTVNNGVYRTGFATSQAAYERGFRALFETLGALEQRLGTRRHLTGERITEADWRLFPTLVRFDAVYHTHFRLNGPRLTEHPNLWAYTRDLYQQPGIAGTVAMDQIKRHYYTTHDMLNPQRIIPLGGPSHADFMAPHGRG